MMERNRRIVLAARPNGLPKPGDFELVTSEIPKAAASEVLVRTVYLSVDPYMRGLMSGTSGYAPGIELGGTMPGGTVGTVLRSEDSSLKLGDTVQGAWGWQEFGVAKAAELRKIDASIAPISTALGILGMPGCTAYFGLLDLGRPRPGETLVVSGAAGAVGSIVGQLAKIQGCTVVGIAGSADKVRYLRESCHFDEAINYKAVGDLGDALHRACPGGVDIYFDNVGGDITDAVIPQINRGARIVVCGQIALYNLDKPAVGPRWLHHLLIKRARAEGFLVFDLAHRFPEALDRLTAWLNEGRLHYREDIVRGLENAPNAFIGMLQGRNIGKQLVQVYS